MLNAGTGTADEIADVLEADRRARERAAVVGRTEGALRERIRSSRSSVRGRKARHAHASRRSLLFAYALVFPTQVAIVGVDRSRCS